MTQPTGHRGSAAERTRRVTQVYKWVVSGMRSDEIQSLVAEDEDWDVSERTVRTYIQQATARLEEEAATVREVELGKARARLDRLFASCELRGDPRGALMVAKEHIALFGLAVPQRVEITIEAIDAEIARIEVELAGQAGAGDAATGDDGG